MSINFMMDNKKFFYKRIEYDLLTYLGDIGGLIDVVMVFGRLITYIFVTRLFHAALVEKAYRLQKYMLDMTPY